MSDHVKKTKEEKDPEVAIENVIGKTESFIMQNGRVLLTALIVVVVVVGGFFGYKYLVAHPRAEKAAAMLYVAEQQFAQDSFALALNGDGNNAGFLQVIANYGSTPQGNLAYHYAGICYLNLGEYEKALEYLRKYIPVNEVAGGLIKAQNYGLQGDAHIQLGQVKEGAAMYEKASKANDNVFTTPYYLKKAGSAWEKLGEHKKALEAYKLISTDYAGSIEARDIQKYIGRLEQL